MFARLQLCLAVALLMVAAGNASADTNKPSIGPTPPASDNAADGSSGAPAYGQAATTDPYKRPDFTTRQSFGLTASQMLGAAAACEQMHSDLVSGRRAKPSKDASDDDRAMLDAAQQHMLDPAATSANTAESGEVDCDRVSAAFGQLQDIQLHNENLGKELDQPGAFSPSLSSKNRGNKGQLQR